MPLNKLENFIKNSEGRILYVNPNDLDATDGIENQGNSLTKPFKTLQRALIESARFSYLKGNDNDITEKTTILLFPGEHLVDNRPGFGIKDVNGTATAISPGSTESGAQNTLTLTLNSNFDLTQEDNILYKFNSTEGGVIVPRGTSIVGLDLRKTKIRPKYVPNPTDDNAKPTAIFRVTGACYFWQFSIFDGNESALVYTDPTNFDETNQSKPIFSHHKVTCFEYADGVNKLDKFGGLTDLDVYYSKLSNAYNRASIRDIDEKFPDKDGGFAKQRPEFEIVGAFSSDRLQIQNIISGDGNTAGQVVTVTTAVPHQLSGGTPIKIEGVNDLTYNISTKVQNVLNETQFTYLLPFVPPNLKAGPAGGLSAGSAEVSVEVDTVTGASPYIFNISLRSVLGMQGMKADGAKATGFRSMVVAQFTGISLQKDDRAFVKYNPNSRSFDGISYQKQVGERLSSEASSLNPATVYHLDKDAVYRDGWKTSHIAITNDAVLQIVSVFAIGYHRHFFADTGGDASITNSNSNFGQFALVAEGFKKESFDKDDKGFITSIIAPKAVVSSETEVELGQFDKAIINSVASNEKLFLLGQNNVNNLPSEIAQGFRIGARVGEKIFVDLKDSGGNDITPSAIISMSKKVSGVTQTVNVTSEKNYEGVHNDTTQGSATLIHKITLSNLYDVGAKHDLNNGESIRIIAENGDLPEGLDPHRTYYAITSEKNSTRTDNIGLTDYEIQIASSKTNAERTTPVYIKTISNPAAGKLKIISRVADKKPGELGHPIQFDSTAGNWFIHVQGASNEIYTNRAQLDDTNEDIPYIKRRSDDRSLDDKLFKIRYVIPKELQNSRDPNDSFIIQDSSFTNVRFDSDFTRTSIGSTDYDFNRNPRFISHLFYNSTTRVARIRSDKNHNLRIGDQIIVKNIIDTVNTSGAGDKGFNGTFVVTNVLNSKTFEYVTTDVLGNSRIVGTYTNDPTTARTTALPRFEKNNNQENLFIYRTETILPYIEGAQDGVFHLYVLNGGNSLEEEFTTSKYNQNVVNLYPELDRDNLNDNPQEAASYAKRFPIGDVVTNDLKKSITRESTNKLLRSFDVANEISDVIDNTTSAVLTFNREHTLNGLVSASSLTGGGGHTDGTYYNVKIFDDASAPASAVWKGATATVVVNGGSVTNFKIEEPGSGYTSSLSPLYFDSSLPEDGGIGGAPSANISIVDSNIQLATGDYVQVTGITTGTDNYFRIQDVPATNKINIKKSGQETILHGQSVISVGPVAEVSGTPSTSNEVTSITTTKAHGLSKGSKFRALDTNDSNLGDYVVSEVVSVTQFRLSNAPSNISSAKYILKHALSSHNANSGRDGESLGTRGFGLYDNVSLKLTSAISTTDQIPVALPDGGGTDADIRARFPLGSYFQIDDEIMRVVDTTLANGRKLKVIRGALGTIVEPHANNQLIKKIKPLAVELRRPSILRASGHTFEYLGYGPGNYSTGLPQVQLKTLTEREEFLSQSQETSCGTVVYTGMNDKGDFYIGNTKISSDSGEQVTFDIPVPTVTGEDPSRLSVVFDEVIVKDRLLVEGGTSKQILSQFDGPVTFNGKVRFNRDLRITSNLTVDGVGRFTNEAQANTSCDNAASGSLIVEGGISVGKALSRGNNQSRAITVMNGTVKLCDTTAASAGSQGSLVVDGGVTINGTGAALYVEGNSFFNQTARFGSNSASSSLEVGLRPITDAAANGGAGVALGSASFAFAEAHIGRIQIGVYDGTPDNGNQHITTRSGPLRLNSASGDIELKGDILVTGKSTFQDDVLIEGDLNVTKDITAFYQSSDKNLKKNIKPIPDALAKILSISGNTYEMIADGSASTGVIAQELEALGLPELTRVNENGYLSVQYHKIIPILIEAIKELNSKVDALS